jgi:hypothetical protein
MQKLGLSLIFSLLFCSPASAEVSAEKLPGTIAMHIGSVHYQHPVHLLHPYLDVWQMQGPLAERAALNALKKRFAQVGDCSTPTSVVLLLEPHLFYNPQLRVFHAEIITRIYTQSSVQPTYGNALSVIKEQAQQIGELSIQPEFYAAQAYNTAMEKVINKLETNPAFLAALSLANRDQPKPICDALDALPAAKFYY